jgi:hypothetical protein
MIKLLRTNRRAERYSTHARDFIVFHFFLASFNNRQGQGPELPKYFKLNLKVLDINRFREYHIVAENTTFNSMFLAKTLRFTLRIC